MLSTENPQKRRIFFIIVHYGAAQLTDQALAALGAGTRTPEHIVIIDQTNGQYLAPAGMSVKVLAVANCGYGAAANIGLGYLLNQSISNTDIVVVMNNDIVVEPTTVADISQWWDKHPEPALVGVTTRENQQALSGGGQISWLTGRARLCPAGSTGRLDYIHGAFVMAPYKVFLTTKGWPENYFMYWEDILLSTRMRRQGLPLRLATTISVQHKVAKSPAGQHQQLYYLVRNGALFMQTETPWAVRQWWRLLNWLRFWWHRWHHPESMVTQALHDALHGHIGPKNWL